LVNSSLREQLYSYISIYKSSLTLMVMEATNSV